MSKHAQPRPQSIFKQLLREPLYWLLAALPIALLLEALHASDLWIFIVSGIAIVPLAGLMGRATENLAATLGAGIGGLLNATFGNAAELIIALMALWKGPQFYPLVKASIAGSIMGNVLLVLGLALFAGGIFYPRQQFNRTAASMGATLMALAAIGLILPTVHYYVFQWQQLPGAHGPDSLAFLSEEIAVVLAGTYVLSLVFSLHTHRHLFAGDEHAAAGPDAHAPQWSRRTCMIVLVLATAGVAGMSELLVGSVEKAAEALGMNAVFVGVIVVAVVGNAAEHSTAVLVAMKNKMDLAVNIAVGSSIQIALFVAPLLVFASMLMGHAQSLDLHFSPLEVIAVVISMGVLSLVCQDGESHWLEGVMLLAVYLILALAFYHLPVTEAHGLQPVGFEG